MSALAPFAVWLLPGEADAARLGERIRQLAARHGGPAFEPHVTLHVGTCSPDLDIDSLLGRVARQAAAPALECLETAASDAYYKTLYVDIAPGRRDGPGLLTLRDDLLHALEAAGAPPSPYEFRPHLSLLYGRIDAALRQTLVASNRLAGHRIMFDRIAGVRPAPGSDSLEQVSDWALTGRHRLAAGSPPA